MQTTASDCGVKVRWPAGLTASCNRHVSPEQPVQGAACRCHPAPVLLHKPLMSSWTPRLHHDLPDCLCEALQSSHTCVSTCRARLRCLAAATPASSAQLPCLHLARRLMCKCHAYSETGTAKQMQRLTLQRSAALPALGLAPYVRNSGIPESGIPETGIPETGDCQAHAEADLTAVDCRCLAAATVKLEAPSPPSRWAAHPACLSARAAAAPAVAAAAPVAAAPLAVAVMAAPTSAMAPAAATSCRALMAGAQAQEAAMGSLE